MQTALVGLSAFGLSRVAADVIRTGDEVFDASKKIGITTEALGALRFAAEQTGASATDLDKSLMLLNRTVGEAQSGAGEYVETFDRLGLSVNKLASMSADQRFLAVANAIRALGTETEQAAAAQEVFGRGGQALLPLIREGQAEILKLGEVAKQTGSLFTGAQAEQANNAADSIGELTASWRGLRIELVTGFVPAITFVSNLLTSVVQGFQKLQLWIEKATLAYLGLFGDTSAEMASVNRRLSGGSSSAPLSAGPSAAGTNITAATAKADQKRRQESEKAIREMRKFNERSAEHNARLEQKRQREVARAIERDRRAREREAIIAQRQRDKMAILMEKFVQGKELNTVELGLIGVR